MGKIASPAMAIIKKAAAVLVNLPTPFNASGQMQGQLSALQKPIEITHNTEVNPSVTMAPIEKQIPKKAQPASALLCEIYLGIKTVPRKYPAIMAYII